MRTGRPKAPLVLTDAERATLESLAVPELGSALPREMVQ